MLVELLWPLQFALKCTSKLRNAQDLHWLVSELHVQFVSVSGDCKQLVARWFSPGFNLWFSQFYEAVCSDQPLSCNTSVLKSSNPYISWLNIRNPTLRSYRAKVFTPFFVRRGTRVAWARRNRGQTIFFSALGCVKWLFAIIDRAGAKIVPQRWHTLFFLSCNDRLWSFLRPFRIADAWLDGLRAI